MTFPNIESITPTAFGSNATAHLVAMPATVNSGDVLVCLFGNDGTATVSTPGGWSAGFSQDGGGLLRGSLFFKVADGSEGGTTVDFVTSASERAAALVYRVSGASGLVENGTAVSTGTTASPDPPSLAPSWGAKDTLWLVFLTMNSGFTLTLPTNYTNSQTVDSGLGPAGCQITSGERELNTASEDPGAFPGGDAGPFVINTIGIEPGSAGTNVTPDPTVVEVSVVTPSKALAITPSSIVVNVLVIAPAAATGSSPSPTIVQVSVVAPSKTLSLTMTPVVVEVLVVAPTISLISFEPNEVWVETWDTQEP